jgi:hypothetical protein
MVVGRSGEAKGERRRKGEEGGTLICADLFLSRAEWKWQGLA